MTLLEPTRGSKSFPDFFFFIYTGDLPIATFSFCVFENLRKGQVSADKDTLEFLKIFKALSEKRL